MAERVRVLAAQLEAAPTSNGARPFRGAPAGTRAHAAPGMREGPRRGREGDERGTRRLREEREEGSREGRGLCGDPGGEQEEEGEEEEEEEEEEKEEEEGVCEEGEILCEEEKG